MEDPQSVSGACTQCFTGFGHYHEPDCPFFGEQAAMNIDLTPEELSQLIRMCEALPMVDAVARIHHKATHALQNFKPPGYDNDPAEAAKKWKAPL